MWPDISILQEGKKVGLSFVPENQNRVCVWNALVNQKQTSKTTFNNDQPRSGKEKDLSLETL